MSMMPTSSADALPARTKHGMNFSGGIVRS